MKKFIMAILCLVLFGNFSNAQVKVAFSLANKTISGGILSYDVQATVPAGQVWNVGACNIRVNFSSNPLGVLTVHADNPVVNANQNISNVNGYQAMTTVPVEDNKAIGLNILNFNLSGFYQFVPGTYTLGKIRFDIISSPFTCDSIKFRLPTEAAPTVVYDSTNLLTYPTQYTLENPVITGEGVITVIVPKVYQLYQNYPNPFNPATTIKYDVPKAAIVKIRIYDITGREISTLVNQKMEAGSYEINWNANRYSSGIYFYKFETDEFTAVKRMVLLK